VPRWKEAEPTLLASGRLRGEWHVWDDLLRKPNFYIALHGDGGWIGFPFGTNASVPSGSKVDPSGNGSGIANPPHEVDVFTPVGAGVSGRKQTGLRLSSSASSAARPPGAE
jgi:hypothetical protein